MARFTALSALAMFVIVAQCGVQSLDITACITSRVAREPHTMHALHAVGYYAAEYPQLNVQTKLIGAYEVGSTTAIRLTRAFAANGSDCDVVVGPSASGLAVTMNPLVNSLWLDYSATAIELGDKSQYPLFNRVAPSDAQSTESMAALFAQFGWNTASSICAEGTYGRSTTNGFSSAFQKVGGTVGFSLCISPNADVPTMKDVLQQVLATPNRVVFVGMASSDISYISLVTAALELKADEQLTFAFSESPCSNNSPLWRMLRGAFCATYSLVTSVTTAFLLSYAARDSSNATTALSAIGWPAGSYSTTSTGIFQAFAVDATRFALRAYHSFYVAKGKRPTAAEIAAFARNQSISGAGSLTGDVFLKSNGDRTAASMVILNSIPSASNATVPVANFSATGIVLADVFYFSTVAGYRAASNAPSSTKPVAKDATAAIVGGVSGAVIALVIAAAVVIVILKRGGARNSAAAPKDAYKPFAIAFTDIQASTTLWAKAPAEMGPALDIHHALMRRIIEQHSGYEVKTIGDSFMVAFQHVGDAARFALAVQEQFYAEEWPSAQLDAIVRAKVVADSGIADVGDELHHHLWSGLRVRVGVHYGTGTIQLDPVTQAYDYYGTVVNTAARVEGVAHGGQVLLTRDAYTAWQAEDENYNTFPATDLGPQPLRGLSEPVDLLQVLPASLSERTFPPLRLDVENAHEEANEGGDGAFDFGKTVGAGAGGETASVTSNSNESAVSDVTKLDREGRVAHFIRAAARRGAKGKNALPRDAIAQRLMAHYQVTWTMVSLVPVEERRKMLKAIGQRWRLPVAAKKQWTDAEEDFSLVDLIRRSVSSVDELTDSGPARNNPVTFLGASGVRRFSRSGATTTSVGGGGNDTSFSSGSGNKPSLASGTGDVSFVEGKTSAVVGGETTTFFPQFGSSVSVEDPHALSMSGAHPNHVATGHSTSGPLAP